MTPHEVKSWRNAWAMDFTMPSWRRAKREVKTSFFYFFSSILREKVQQQEKHIVQKFVPHKSTEKKQTLYPINYRFCSFLFRNQSFWQVTISININQRITSTLLRVEVLDVSQFPRRCSSSPVRRWNRKDWGKPSGQMSTFSPECRIIHQFIRHFYAHVTWVTQVWWSHGSFRVLPVITKSLSHLFIEVGQEHGTRSKSSGCC